MRDYKYIRVKTKDNEIFSFDYDTHDFDLRKERGRLTVVNTVKDLNVLLVPIENLSYVVME